MKTTTTILTIAAAVALAACNQESATGTGDTEPPADSSSLDALLVNTAPAGAIPIVEARKNPVPGTEITISGKVIGRAEPFVEGRALVTLGDPATLTSCDLRPGDDCPTPWDVCCDDPAVIKKSIATVQVVDDSGSPVKVGLKGLGGMKELSSLIVTGTVAEGSNADNLVVNATGIHVVKAE